MSDIFLGLRNLEKKLKDNRTDDSSSTESDSFVDSFIGMTGGTENYIPNAGYPPIQICTIKKIDNDKSLKELKKKEFAVDKSSNNNLSIHQILKNRKARPMFEI
jgi:hypothetical protein